MEWVPWQDAAVGAATAAAATPVLRDRVAPACRALAAWTRELALVFALYALWQLAGDLSLGQPDRAVARGRDIARWESWFHLPSEASAQRVVLGDHELVRFLNYYYAVLHVAALGICLVWLFVRHRDRYPAVRNVLVLVTGASLLIQLVPVAPPRLVHGLGLVDTGHLVGPSVYSSTPAPGLDQLSAMPSLHVGWALVVAGAVVYALRTPWRWLAWLYPVATGWVVVVTGNHYWADGLAELPICGLALAAVWAWLSMTRRRRGSREQAGADGVPPDRTPALTSSA